MYNVNKIFEMMEEKGLNSKQMAQAIGIGVSNFTEWRKGRNKPSDKMMSKIADFFNTPLSTFYDAPPSPVAKQVALRIMDISRRHSSTYEVFKKADVDYSLFHALEDGYMIDREHIEKIALILGCSVEYLLGNVDDPTPTGKKKSSPEPMSSKEALKQFLINEGIITADRDITEDEEQTLRALADAFFNKGK